MRDFARGAVRVIAAVLAGLALVGSGEALAQGGDRAIEPTKAPVDGAANVKGPAPGAARGGAKGEPKTEAASAWPSRWPGSRRRRRSRRSC